MSETSSRELYNLLVKMNVHFKTPNNAKLLATSGLAKDFAGLFALVVNLSRDAQDEVFRANFPNKSRAIELAERLEDAQREIVNTLSKRGQGNISGPITGQAIEERLLSIAEQVENAGLSGGSATREQMINETETFIADVKTWEMDDYAKRTLIIQLDHFSRIIHAADSYSKADLRRRVKEIIADFAAEFSQMDKAHQTNFERMLLWARRGFFTGTIFLGLTADVTSITAALPPPPKMIGR